MSNLKKVVSLVLVLAMVFAMGASASAAFSDKDDINFTDEVNLLTSLNVLSGYPDGSFKPAGSVTRAEYAKMLFMVKLGHLDASGFESTVVPFTDLGQAAWAQGYIKYLYSIGVVAGKSATAFDPNAQVTGYEAVKMLLVVLGYKADQAQLVGAKWKLNTLALGVDRGILDDYDKDFDAPATRELAALLIANALDAVCVKYSGLSLDPNGNLTADVVDETHNEGTNTVLSTLGWKAFGLVYETGYLVETNHMAAPDIVNEKSPEATKATEDDNFSILVTGGTSSAEKGDLLDGLELEDLDESLIGQEVTVSYKVAKNGDKEVYGVVPTGKSKVYTSALVDTKYEGGDTDKLTIKPDGTKKEFKKVDSGTINLRFVVLSGGEVVYDDETIDAFDSDKGLNLDADADIEYPLGREPKIPGNITIVDMDGDGTPEYGFSAIGTFGRVDTYDEEDEEFELVGDDTYTFEDDDFDDVSGDFEVGDYCFVTLGLDGAIEVVPAEKATLKPSKIQSSKVYDGDKAYYCYAAFVNIDSFDFDTTYTVYTNGTFIARRTTDSTEVATVDDIALATYIDSDLKVVKLLNADGDEDIYTYTNKNTDEPVKTLMTALEVADAKNAKPQLVKFSVNDDGKVKLSEIKASSTIVANIDTEYTADKTLVANGRTYYLDSSSVVFVTKRDEANAAESKVYSKSDLGKTAIAGDTALDIDDVIYRTVNGSRYVVAASVTSKTLVKLPDAAGDDKYVFLTEDPTTFSNSDGKFFSLNGQSEGSDFAYTSDENVSLSSSAKKFSWVSAKLVDEEIDAATLAGGKNATNFNTTDTAKVGIGAIKSYDADYEEIVFYAENANDIDTHINSQKEFDSYAIDDDTDFYIVNNSGILTTATVDDLKTADYNSATDSFYTNVFYKLKDASTLDFVVISSTNRLSSIDSSFQWTAYKYVKSVDVAVDGGGDAEITGAVGTKLQLVATVLPADANTKTVTWSSSDTDVATVSATGEVSSVADGSVTITATSTTDSSISDSITIDVDVTP